MRYWMETRDVMFSWRINFWHINILGTPPLEWYYAVIYKRMKDFKKKLIYFQAFFVDFKGCPMKPRSWYISPCKRYMTEIFERETICWKWFLRWRFVRKNRCLEKYCINQEPLIDTQTAFLLWFLFCLELKDNHCVILVIL